MAQYSSRVVFRSSLKRVWDIITGMNDQRWRTDLIQSSVISQDQFLEISVDGVRTIGTITNWKTYHFFEYEYENDNVYGHRYITFREEDGLTVVEIEEEADAKKLMARPMLLMNMKKAHQRYMDDLRRII